MSTPLESIVRPFTDKDVFPTPFTKPGERGSQMVRIIIGSSGSIKTMGMSASASMTTKMGQPHREKPPDNSASLQRRLGEAAGA